MNTTIMWTVYIITVVVVVILCFFLFNLWLAIANGLLAGLLAFLVLADRLSSKQKRSISYYLLFFLSWGAFIISYGWFLFLAKKI